MVDAGTRTYRAVSRAVNRGMVARRSSRGSGVGTLPAPCIGPMQLRLLPIPPWRRPTSTASARSSSPLLLLSLLRGHHVVDRLSQLHAGQHVSHRVSYHAAVLSATQSSQSLQTASFSVRQADVYLRQCWRIHSSSAPLQADCTP